MKTTNTKENKMKFTKMTAKKIMKAVEIANNITSGCYRRAEWRGEPSNFKGYKDFQGRAFVIGDSLMDIPTPERLFIGDPAILVTENTTEKSLIDGTY